MACIRTVSAWLHVCGLTLQSRGRAPASRVTPLISNVRPHLNITLVATVALTLSIDVNAFAAGVESCSKMLVAAPGSVEARACFAREMNVLRERMKGLTSAIEVEVGNGLSSFKVEDFKSSQAAWEQYVASTCWLDAAGAGNTNAVFEHCASKYTLQRLSQLQALHKSLTGEQPVIWPMSNLGTAR